MKLVKLNEIFDIKYGSQLDLNKMKIDLVNGVNFVSRSKENLGVYTKISKINKPPFQKGSITSTLGGSYLLSTFVQQKPFYTAQNIKVLIPKKDMTDLEKKFYCYVIEINRFRYTSHGREANKTLDSLIVPSIESIPSWVNDVKIPERNKKPLINKDFNLNINEWKEFYYKDIFDIYKGKTPKNKYEGDSYLISATSFNNGVSQKIDKEGKIFSKNSISVASNGDVGMAFYQSKDFMATGDVNILYSKFKLNKYIAMFLNAIIMKEKIRFCYGRKWGKEKMLEHKIKLPVDSQGNPDWQFMENYIKSINYSSNL